MGIKVGFSGKEAHDSTAEVWQSPEGKGVCASTPVSMRVCGCEDLASGGAVEAEGRGFCITFSCPFVVE